jgi:opacity protein-like surface antigen
MKRLFLSAVVVSLWLAVMATNAGAFSLEARVGAGIIGERSSSDISTVVVGMNAFLYEGKTVDFLVSLEQMTFQQPLVIAATSYDFDATALILSPALRFKFNTTGTWKPFITLGILAHKTTYDIPSDKSMFFKETERTDLGARAGVGIDIGLTERFSLGLEYNATTGMSFYYDTLEGLYSLENGEATAYTANIGLRYYF